MPVSAAAAVVVVAAILVRTAEAAGVQGSAVPVAGLRAVAAFGGLSKFDQFKELKAGCEIAVATPGRIMDLIRMKACTTRQVTYLVLDEADRMFDMGFEQQVCVLWEEGGLGLMGYLDKADRMFGIGCKQQLIGLGGLGALGVA